MRKQFANYPFDTVMVLGVAGGNGLEHVSLSTQKTVFAVDINPAYLEACQTRFPMLATILVPICADLTKPNVQLPQAYLVIANLFIEYVGRTRFQRVIEQVRPQVVSCVIQCDNGNTFVSTSGMLGHYSAGFTLDTYTHVTTAAKKEAANTMGSVLSGAIR